MSDPTTNNDVQVCDCCVDLQAQMGPLRRQIAELEELCRRASEGQTLIRDIGVELARFFADIVERVENPEERLIAICERIAAFLIGKKEKGG